jgi:hypothetical protein
LLAEPGKLNIVKPNNEWRSGMGITFSGATKTFAS